MRGSGKFDDDPDHLDAIVPAKDPDELDGVADQSAPVEIPDMNGVGPPAYPDLPIAADPDKLKEVIDDLSDRRGTEDPGYTNGPAKGTFDKVDVQDHHLKVKAEASNAGLAIGTPSIDAVLDADGGRDDTDDDDGTDDADDPDDPANPEDGEAARSGVTEDVDVDVVLAIEDPLVSDDAALEPAPDAPGGDQLDLEA